MSFSPSIRKAVYDKYGGHCAYCGIMLKPKEMQVDHFIPKKGWNESGSDDIENLMPACRMCNHYRCLLLPLLGKMGNNAKRILFQCGKDGW